MTRASIFTWLILPVLVSACAGTTGDDGGAPPTVDNPMDDDTDPEDPTGDDSDHWTDDDAGHWADDDTGPPACQQVQEPPPSYRDHEALWLVARFDDPAVPIAGLYAYFWIDWFDVEGCSYSSALAAFYRRDGEPIAEGGPRADWDVTYGPGYDIAVGDVIAARARPDEPGVMDVRVRGEDISATLTVRREQAHWWSPVYVSWFRSIADAQIDTGDGEHDASGPVTLERWWGRGSFPPAEGLDLIHGWWIYAPMSWTGENGEAASTLVWIWVGLVGGEPVIVRADGVIGTDAGVEPLTVDGWDFSDPRNDGEYLNHYSIWGTAAGAPFEYELTQSFRYIDRYPDDWEQLYAPDAYAESHDIMTGTLTLDGRPYTGGGIEEWHTSAFNPLVE